MFWPEGFVNCLQVEKCHDFTFIRVRFRVRAEVKMERMEMKSRGEGSCTRESLRSVWQNTNGLYRKVTQQWQCGLRRTMEAIKIKRRKSSMNLDRGLHIPSIWNPVFDFGTRYINSLLSQHFSTCKQLTKTLGSKRPAVDWLIVVYCSSVNFTLLYQRNYEPLQYHS